MDLAIKIHDMSGSDTRHSMVINNYLSIRYGGDVKWI